MSEGTAHLRLIDDPDGYPRTSRSLVASFAARLGTLGYVTGGEAMGSELAGIAALGRATAQTAEGSRLRRALEASRAGGNGEELWAALRVGDWLSRMPPAPVLDHLHNDLAMLLAEDLPEVLASPPEPAAGVPASTLAEPEPVHILDVLVGLWAWGRELVRSVEAAAGPLPGNFDIPEHAPGPSLDGGLLR